MIEVGIFATVLPVDVDEVVVKIVVEVTVVDMEECVNGSTSTIVSLTVSVTNRL